MHCQSHLMYQRFREAVTTRCDRMMLETTQADARWRYPINAATLDAVLAASLQLGNKLCKRQRHRETLGDRLKPISLAPINCNQRTNIIPMELDSMTRHEAVLDSASSDRIPNCNTSSRRLHTWQTSLDSMIESQEVLQSASSSGSSTTPRPCLKEMQMKVHRRLLQPSVRIRCLLSSQSWKALTRTRLKNRMTTNQFLTHLSPHLLHQSPPLSIPKLCIVIVAEGTQGLPEVQT